MSANDPKRTSEPQSASFKPLHEGGDMQRRQFIAVLGAAATLPVVARAQQNEHVRRIALLTGTTADDPDSKARLAAFEQALGQLGWTQGRNVRIDYRFFGGDAATSRKQAEELVALAPDVIVSSGSSSTGPILQATHSVPVVFTIVPDPVGSGFVDSLSQPGGNATGFMQFEYGFSGKWLELLKEIAPSLTRVITLWDPAITAGIGQFTIIQSVATSAGIDVKPVKLRDAGEVERAITDFARTPNGGLIVTASALSAVRRDLIIALAARHKLPAVYNERFFVTAGGLISYGASFIDQFRQAAGYVDRILKGEKAADLPVQGPAKYELVINLKTAKTIGLAMPPSVLARADEVIE
jgi:putative tryptophan/tyrosine transport system substrate-binding protein